MENMKSLHEHLENLQSQAKKLTESGLALNSIFAREEIRLNREDEASSLRAVYRAVVGQLQRLERTEASVERARSQASLMFSLGGLAVAAMGSKSKRLSAMKDYLLREPTDRQRPFGLVMVCIGSKGLPDDVRGISISQLARESGRQESQIINKLREDGYLLFSEHIFSLLIDGLSGHIREGKLNLPVSRDKLAEITGLKKPKPRIKVIEAE
jgi:hypothetical protein